MWREPLVVFLLIGGLVFAVDAYWASTRKEQIIVDQSTIDYLIARQENVELREIRPDEIGGLIEAHIEDELLYREAYKRGLNEGDTRMRRNMILKLKGLMVTGLDEPTDEELRTFYEDSQKRYTSEEQFEIDHLYFSKEGSVPGDLQDQLEQGADFKLVSESYSRTLGRSNLQATRSDLSEFFGTEAAHAIVDAKNDGWMGPFSSQYGVHFIRRNAVIPPQTASFEDVAPYLRMDWQSSEVSKLIEAELEAVRSNYDIRVERN